MARTRLPAKARREQIINVAASLFESEGYQTTSMEQIADKVGIAKASLYYYFDSKEQLLVDLHEEMMFNLLARQAARTQETELSSEQTLKETMRDILDLMESRPGRLRIFFEAYRALPTKFGEEIARQRRRYRQSVVETIQRGVDRGEFRECDPELTALALLGMCNWSYQWYRIGGRLRAEAIADEFWELLMSGLRLES